MWLKEQLFKDNEMGTRQDNILKYIKDGYGYDFTKPVIPKIQDYKASKWYDEIFDIYQRLGGIQNEIPVGIKPKDLDFAINGKILELDEENHFNRYRAITLTASIYQNTTTLSKFNYLAYCQKHEHKCQVRGGYWSSESSEKQFGKSNIEGDLSANGSARWKQRAFYDLLKDFIPYITGFNNTSIKRISIYDTVDVDGKRLTINDILKHYKPEFAFALKTLIESVKSE